jgi:hypothetical protein
MELRESEINVVIAPYFINLIKEIGCPFVAAVSLTRTLAAAPIIVKLPPKQAPKERAHHRG